MRHAKEPPKQLYFVCSRYCFCTMMKDMKRVKRRPGRRFLSFSLRKVVYHHLRSLITLLITLQISPMIAEEKILFMVDSKSECKEQIGMKLFEVWGSFEFRWNPFTQSHQSKSNFGGISCSRWCVQQSNRNREMNLRINNIKSESLSNRSKIDFSEIRLEGAIFRCRRKYFA